MAEQPDVRRDLQTLEVALKQLEAEYNMFFAGRLPRLPWETRARVEALVKKHDRSFIRNTADRAGPSPARSRRTLLVRTARSC